MEEQPRYETLLSRLASVRALQRSQDKVYQVMADIGMATPAYTAGYNADKARYQRLEKSITGKLERYAGL